MSTNKSKQSALAAAIIAIAAPYVVASTWVGPTGNWGDNTQWSDQTVPNSSTADAVVGTGSVNLDAAYIVRDFDLTGGAIDGTAGGQLTVGTQFRFLGGSVIGHARVFVNGTAQLGNGAATLTNAGSLSFAQSPIADAATIFNNSGQVSLGTNVTLQLLNGSTTSGTYAGGSGSKLIFGYGGVTSTSPTYTIAQGAHITTPAFQASATNLQLEAGSQIEATSVLIDSSTNVRGEGNFTHATHVSSGDLQPGQTDGAIGTFHFDSSLTLDTSPTYQVNLKNDGGSAATDLLDAVGAVSLNGVILSAVVPDGGQPFTPNQRFVIIQSATGLQGDTATMIDRDASLDANGFVVAMGSMGRTYDFTLDITANDVALVYADTNATPEPGLLLPAMLVPALIGVLRRRRLP